MQQAGFQHVHRTSSAISPHCVFDVVIPYQNMSHQERIVGQYCTPEHVTGGAAVGDYDGDGLEDVYFTVFHDRSVLYKNNGEICRTAFNNDLKCLLLSLPSTRMNMITKSLSNCLNKP